VTYQPTEGTVETDFFAREHVTPEGWSLPLRGNITSWIYVSTLDFAFEVWLDGDWDVTVRLERPLTYGPKDGPTKYDPRAGRKGILAPLLDLDDLTVAEFLVKQVGELEITFTDESRLVAGPADDGQTWCLEWPMAGHVGVASRSGGGLLWPTEVRSTDLPAPDGPIHATAYREPVRRGDILDLPIAGLVAESTASSLSIELAMPISGSDRYDVPFGGALEIVDPAGESWRGRGDSEVRSSLGPVLNPVGNRVTGAHADEEGRLHLAFADGAQLIAESDRREARWPIAPGSLDEHWVPREGPSLP
jgi:hypothetical protein